MPEITNAGPFSPYPRPDVYVGIDPLLVWAEKTKWLDFPNRDNDTYATLSWKFPLQAGIDSPFFTFYGTGKLPKQDSADLFAKLATFAPQKNEAYRIELAMPLGANRASFREEFTITPGNAANTESMRQPEIYFGVIDDGCPYARPDLVRIDSGGKASSRVQHLWDQGAVPVSGRTNIPYGAEYDLSIRPGETEDATYERQGYTAMRRSVTHGAHVLGALSAGSPVSSRVTRRESQLFYESDYEEKISDADIGFVQLPATALADLTGTWLCSYVLDGVDYLLAGAAKKNYKVVVINVSFGPQQGPHDGTSFFEEALDYKITQWRSAHPRTRLDVVLPSGNSFSARAHAKIEVRAGAGNYQTLNWLIPPGSEKTAFLEIWLAAIPTENSVTIKLRDPNGRSVVCKPDATAYLMSPGTTSDVYAGVIFTATPARSKTGAQVLLAVTPTQAFTGERALGVSGRWTIEICNCSNAAVEGDAYIARNGVTLLRKTRGRQSYFMDPAYDPEAFERSAEDDPSPPASAIRRRGTLSGIATGNETWIAAGYRLRDVEADKGPRGLGDHPAYSSAGKGRSLNGAMREVSISAPTDYSRAHRGVPSTGTRGRSVAWMTGTSTAAPQVARELALRAFNQLPQRADFTNDVPLYGTKYIKAGK